MASFACHTSRTALVVLAAIALGGSTMSIAAAAPLRQGPNTFTPRSSVPGTATSASYSATRTTTKLAATSAVHDAAGALSTVTREVIHGGYTAAGIGMRNLGHGTIDITGVPAGATVKSAILMWDILASQQDGSLADGKINGEAISGAAWASGPTPCWQTVSKNFSYEANVSKLVTGNGLYALTGFATGESDGADPWTQSAAPLLEGASLVVIYELAAMPRTVIQIAEGASEIENRQQDATLDGFTASVRSSAITTYIVADGQQIGNTAGFNGHALAHVGFSGADPQAVPRYSRGDLWDTVTNNVSSLVRPGETSAKAAVTAGHDPATGLLDCVVWVGQVLAVSQTPVLVGIYSDFKFAGQVTKALGYGWPLIANVAGLGRKAPVGKGPAICSGSFTRSFGTDKNVESELSKHATTAPWVSYWTVAAPPPSVKPQDAGFAAGQFAAAEIKAVWISQKTGQVLPSYVALDPEGPACGGRSWEKMKKKTNVMTNKDWKEFALGWEQGVRTFRDLSPAIYVGQSEFRARKVSEFGLPVFLAVGAGVGHVRATNPRVKGPGDIVGYVAFYAACKDAGPDIRQVESWGAPFSSVQFLNAKDICKP